MLQESKKPLLGLECVQLNGLVTKPIKVVFMDWNTFFSQEQEKKYFGELDEYLCDLRGKGYTIYPPLEDTFRAYKDVPFDKVKVVILGQDPYHGAGQANGRAFAVNKGIVVPPSLRNIFKEIKSEYGEVNADETLSSWAEQGVFLLNASLTVLAGQPASMQNIGWDIFTDNTIKALAQDSKPKVFMLWGNFAKKKEYLIKDTSHLILKAAHPSPLSANRGFFGCNHFIAANGFLRENGICEILW